jgi:hypothetical protein
MACPVGAPDMEENEYAEHMATVHQGKSQLESIRQQKEIEDNVPKIIPLSKDAPLDPEFAQMVQAMDAPKPPEVIPMNPALIKPTITSESKPLKLKYIWEGNCPQDNTPVRTVITKVDGRWFASAFCISHETIDQREVTPIDAQLGRMEQSIKDIRENDPAIDRIMTEKEVKDVGELNVPKKSPRKTKV